MAQVSRSDGPGEISVTLEDQAENDFRPAVARLATAMKDVDPDRNVLVSTVGRSFYEQCLPSNSLHFATSNYAAMYLDTSRKPEGDSGFKVGYDLEVWHRLRAAEGQTSCLSEADRAQIAATKEKAAFDWERFLLLSSKGATLWWSPACECCGVSPARERGVPSLRWDS